jgi:hypothetical protein
MRKTKSLGPSNDNVPVPEMFLAKILQNAHAQGLGFCTGTAYRSVIGLPTTLDKAVSCCAMGAWWLTAMLSDRVPYAGLALGNDEPPSTTEGAEGIGPDIGRCFRDAMT